MFPPFFGSFFTHIVQTKNMGVVASQDDVLTLVHPGRRLELFRQPIRAGELMMKYPRHCIARPDVFEFPWIALHPQAILPRGCVFFLVPYYTIHALLKSRQRQRQRQQPQQQQDKLKPSEHKPSLHCLSYNRSDHQEFCDGGNLYRFIARFMKRNMNQREERSYYQSDSSVDSSQPRPRVTSGELTELMRIKPCLRGPESDRKKLNLRVRFYDPTAILSRRRGYPCH